MKYLLFDLVPRSLLIFAQGDGSVVPEGGVPPEGAATDQSFLVQFFGNPLNLILVCGVLFILMVLRPQQKEMKALQQALANLKKNDRVVTSSGIHGTVIQVNAGEPVVTLRIDDNSGARITINRDAIARITNTDEKE